MAETRAACRSIRLAQQLRNAALQFLPPESGPAHAALLVDQERRRDGGHAVGGHQGRLPALAVEDLRPADAEAGDRGFDLGAGLRLVEVDAGDGEALVLEALPG